MNWIYIQSEPHLWTVGFYDPDGKFRGDSDHAIREDAAERAHFLNGGEMPKYYCTQCNARMKRVVPEQGRVFFCPNYPDHKRVYP